MSDEFAPKELNCLVQVVVFLATSLETKKRGPTRLDLGALIEQISFLVCLA